MCNKTKFNFFNMSMIKYSPAVFGIKYSPSHKSMVPLRLISGGLGTEVGWDAEARAVDIIQDMPRPSLENLPRSGVTLPNRRLTNAELEEWIVDYNKGGGAIGIELEHFRLVNEYREEQGLKPFELDNRLMMAARFKAQEMHDLGYFDHASPVYGESHSIPVELFGFTRQGHENIINGSSAPDGFSDPEAALIYWLNSPGHRGNIVHPNLSAIGVGFYRGYWVQMFGVASAESSQEGGLYAGVPGNVTITFSVPDLMDGHYDVYFNSMDFGSSIRSVTNSGGWFRDIITDGTLRVRTEELAESGSDSDTVEVRNGMATIILYGDSTTVAGGGRARVWFSTRRGAERELLENVNGVFPLIDITIHP